MDNANERELIDNCMNGGRQAIEGFLVKYEKPVYNAAYRMLNSPEDARVDCSYEEIGQILDLSEKRVKPRLYTGRQLLKDALTKSGMH